jgi:proteasome lid subunit RPN8/RPN11
MIQFTHAVLDVITRHGESAYPEECCGALLGTAEPSSRRVSEALPLENGSQEERRRRFVIRAEDYRAAERAAQERGLVLVGFYHSHPDHPAMPSDYDLEHALPWHSYLILSVRDGQAEAWTVWTLKDDRSRLEPDEAEILPANRSTNGRSTKGGP